jgi:hypothetical protein
MPYFRLSQNRKRFVNSAREPRSQPAFAEVVLFATSPACDRNVTHRYSRSSPLKFASDRFLSSLIGQLDFRRGIPVCCAKLEAHDPGDRFAAPLPPGRSGDNLSIGLVRYDER